MPSEAKKSTEAELQARIEELEAKLKAKTGGGTLTLKPTEKGGLAVYGMGRFPITHYPNQWQRILANAETIQDFINKHSDWLAFKNEDGETTAPAHAWDKDAAPTIKLPK